MSTATAKRPTKPAAKGTRAIDLIAHVYADARRALIAASHAGGCAVQHRHPNMAKIDAAWWIIEDAKHETWSDEVHIDTEAMPIFAEAVACCTLPVALHMARLSTVFFVVAHVAETYAWGDYGDAGSRMRQVQQGMDALRDRLAVWITHAISVESEEYSNAITAAIDRHTGKLH